MLEIFTALWDKVTSRLSDQNVEALQDSVKALNYELSMLRYKDSDDTDIRLAYDYLKQRPFCAALFPYELVREMPSVEVRFDKKLKMCYVLHDGKPLYFPIAESAKLVRLLYLYALVDDDILGKGYRERSPHAFQSERYHIEAGDVLIDAGGWTAKDMIDDSTDEVLNEVLNAIVEDAVEKVKDKVHKNSPENPTDKEQRYVEKDVGSARGLLALDVIDRVSKVYLVEKSKRWWKPLHATFAPYKDKIEFVKGDLVENKQDPKKKKKKETVRLADLLERCGQQRVFVMMDMEGQELEVLREAQEFLRTATNPITLAVCAYHRTTDYADLLHFFESIGYQTETQPGYMYTDMNDGHGLHSLRRGVVRASNVI